MNLLLAQAEVAGRRLDVRIHGERITALAPRLRPVRDEEVVDAAGAALIPGLHDHHIHLLATAAARGSVPCGPPDVRDLPALAAALRAAGARLPAGGWIRGIGYADSVAGPLDRHVLDRLAPEHAVRVQHRSGALWVLNTTALQRARLHDVDDPDVERDAAGNLTGRLWRYDTRLRSRIAATTAAPDLAAVSRQLSSYGVTGVTDATPELDDHAVSLLGDAVRSRQISQHLVLLGAGDGAVLPASVSAGPWKLLLRDHDLPPIDELVAAIEVAHRRQRPVAVHCVTREALLLTLLALETAGPLAGDRIEHAAVVPPGMVARLVALGTAVVTQPMFLAERGDDYLRDVERDDVPHLYPYGSLLAAGIPVAASSDAPFGHADPWRAIAAARDRTSPSGVALGPGERVDAVTTLRGLLSPPMSPGGPPRTVAVGGAADLCLLDAPLPEVLAEPAADRVRLVLRAGTAVHCS